MERTCKHCKTVFTIQADEEAFLGKMSFTYGSQVIHPEAPVLCPQCRSIMRTCQRNERALYKTRSAFSGKDIISIFAPEPLWGEPFKVYAEDEWRSDRWDPLEFGRQYDFGKTFFDQFAALVKAVPRIAVTTMSNENSGFTTGTGFCKNCYLINSSEYCEDCYYGKLNQSCKDSMDCSYLYTSEQCYECFSVSGSTNCQHLSFSHNCHDCSFSSNLRSCSNCCLCTNLDRKEYYFMNESLDKEEYKKRLREYRGSFALTEKMKEFREQRMLSMIHKYANVVNCESCTGDYLENSRKCIDCYDVNDSQDCRYVQVGVKVKDNYDCSNMYINPELCYEVLGTIEVYNCAYSIYVFNSQNLLYCDYCFNCSDCFACSGLTRKKHCIMNVQYSEEEYTKLVPKIVAHMRKAGEWGLFFPAKYSPYGYNESLASEYVPLTKEAATAQGFLWREKDIREYRPQTCGFPENITEAPDSITQEILACSTCSRNYRIIPQELQYYRKHSLPIPRKCPDCRQADRMRLRNPRKLWGRPCGKCGKAMETTYSPERPEKVYCETCYLKEVY